MLESDTENALATWKVDQCGFTIDYSVRVIDDIRLAVVDAFFSLPRGGAEIGGILLGTHTSHRVTITGHQPLDCEHATGPSFVLSPNDHAKLADMLAAARGNPGGPEPVGWYHSHTRSDIHLSAPDVLIHRRYFPELWQVALVMRPHTFQPTKAGFFFQEADGSIRATASYHEVVLEPLEMRPLPDPGTLPPPMPTLMKAPPPPAPAPAPIPVYPPRREPEAAPAVTALASTAEPQARSTIQPMELSEIPAPVDIPPREVEPEPLIEPDAAPPVEVAPPAFTQGEPARSWGGFGVLAALVVGLGLGAAGYQTRQLWLPHIMPSGQNAPAAANASSIGLTTLDVGGQLQIRWDRDSAAVRGAEEASLVIEDGSALPQAVQLDSTHLRLGSFTYGRQTERVDVAFTLHGPNGQTVREVSTYLGKLPDRAPAPSNDSDPAAVKAEDEAKELRGRTKKLEKTVDDLRQQIKRDQKRKRLENQSPDSVKQQ